MNISEKHFLPEIPAKCLKCPGLKTILERIEKFDKQAEGLQVLGRQAMAGAPAEISELLVEAIGVPESEVEEIFDESNKMLRKAVANGLDYNDDHIAEERFYMKERIEGCDGVLSMRVSRGDLEYTTSICASPAQEFEESTVEAVLRIRPVE